MKSAAFEKTDDVGFSSIPRKTAELRPFKDFRSRQENGRFLPTKLFVYFMALAVVFKLAWGRYGHSPGHVFDCLILVTI